MNKRYRLIHIPSGEFVEFEEKELSTYTKNYKGLQRYIRTGCFSYFNSPGHAFCFGGRCRECPWNYSLQFNDLEYDIVELEE